MLTLLQFVLFSIINILFDFRQMALLSGECKQPEWQMSSLQLLPWPMPNLSFSTACIRWVQGRGITILIVLFTFQSQVILNYRWVFLFVNHGYGPDTYITRFVSRGPKFAFEFKKSDGGMGYVRKLKGLRSHNQNAQKINFEGMRQMILQDSDAIEVSNTVIRKTTSTMCLHWSRKRNVNLYITRDASWHWITVTRTALKGGIDVTMIIEKVYEKINCVSSIFT